MVSTTTKKMAPNISGLRKKSNGFFNPVYTEDQPWKCSPTTTNPFDDDYNSIPPSSPSSSSSSSSSSECDSVHLSLKRKAGIQKFLHFFRKRNDLSKQQIRSTTELYATHNTSPILSPKRKYLKWRYSLRSKYLSRGADVDETTRLQMFMLEVARQQTAAPWSETMEIVFTSNSIIDWECGSDAAKDEGENDCRSNQILTTKLNDVALLNATKVEDESDCLNNSITHDNDDIQESSETQEQLVISHIQVSTIESCGICSIDSSESASSRRLDDIIEQQDRDEVLGEASLSSSEEIDDSVVDNNVDDGQQSKDVDDDGSRYFNDDSHDDDGVSSISLDSIRRHNPYWTPEHQEFMTSPPLIVSFVPKTPSFSNKTTANCPGDIDYDDNCSWLSLPHRSTNLDTDLDKPNAHDVLPEWQASWLNYSQSFDSPSVDSNIITDRIDRNDWLTPTKSNQQLIHNEVKRSSIRWKWSTTFISTPTKIERIDTVSQQPPKAEPSSPVTTSPAGRNIGLDTASLLRPLKLRFNRSAPYIPILDHSKTITFNEEMHEEPSKSPTDEVELRPSTVCRSISTPLYEKQNTKTSSTTVQQRCIQQVHATGTQEMQQDKHHEICITAPQIRQQKFQILSGKRSESSSRVAEQVKNHIQRQDFTEMKNGDTAALRIPTSTTCKRPSAITMESYMTSTGAVMMPQLATMPTKFSTNLSPYVKNKDGSLITKYRDRFIHSESSDRESDRIPMPVLPSLLPLSAAQNRQLRKDRLLLSSPHSKDRRTLSSPLTTSPLVASKADINPCRVRSEDTITAPYNKEDSRIIWAIDSLLMDHLESTENRDNIDPQKTNIDVIKDDSTLFWHNGRLQLLASPQRYNTLYGMKNVVKKINKENIKEFLV